MEFVFGGTNNCSPFSNGLQNLTKTLAPLNAFSGSMTAPLWKELMTNAASAPSRAFGGSDVPVVGEEESTENHTCPAENKFQ